jgi:hypothetical protein
VATVSAQEPEAEQVNLRQDAVKIFIDCRFCDMNYIRQQIPYVNYVRDMREAEVYILETRQNTGSGGNEYTFTFIGQNQFEGKNDTLVYTSRPDDTRDHIREGQVQMMQMGLMRYVATTPLYEDIMIGHRGITVDEEVVDRWNNWVFELETRPRLELEESLKEISWRNSISASKITPKWKLEFDYDYSYTKTKRVEEEEVDSLGTLDKVTEVYERMNQGLDNLIVKSIGEHWSAGVQFDISSSTYRNTKLHYTLFPSLEYNIFPYSESTHKQLRILYGAGYNYTKYNDTTIYDKIEDKLFQQELRIAFQVQQKWGSVNISLQGSNFFHDFEKNRLELEGSIRIRIVKGLSIELNGGVARIRDQLSLVKGEEATTEEVYLRLRELATGYNIDGSLSITYTFGSIYNNIVNPRFGNGGGYYRY